MYGGTPWSVHRTERLVETLVKQAIAALGQGRRVSDPPTSLSGRWTSPYVVVRWRAGRPAAVAIWVSSSMDLREPCFEPAILLMVSSINVPPTSFTPPLS